MKKLLLILVIITWTHQSWSMDSFLRALAGEHILDYRATNPEDREPPINILNQTGQSILLQASYDCKTRLLYTSILCFGRCCSLKSFPAVTECEDSHILFNNGQTISLSPIQPELANSRIRLKALKARFAHGPGNWVVQTIPSEQRQATYPGYQCLQELLPGSRVYTLTHEDGTIVLQ